MRSHLRLDICLEMGTVYMVASWCWVMPRSFIKRPFDDSDGPHGLVALLQEDNFYGNKNNVFGDETLLYILAVPHVDGSTIEGLEPVVVPPA